MNPSASVLHLDGVEVDVVRKDVRHVRISVHPPDGRVRVSVPKHVRDAELVRILTERMPWIRGKQAEVQAREAWPPPGFASGELHLFGGREYRLVVVEKAGRPSVALAGDTLQLLVPPGASLEFRAAVLERWYRRQLGECLEPLVKEWAQRMGVDVPEVRIKRMKTRWGSCNVRARRIWLNLELVKRSPASLEYVVVHELAHLIEPGHGPRFRALLDKYLPGWRREREALKKSPR